MASDLIGVMFGFGFVVRPYMERQLAESVAAKGLSSRALPILDFIESKGAVTFGEIAQNRQFQQPRGTSTSRLSAAVAELFRQGVVTRAPNPSDLRTQLISLSEKGKRVQQEVAQVRRRVFAEIRDAMQLNKAEEVLLETAFLRGTKNFRSFLANRPE